MFNLVLVMIGGAVGSAARYGLSLGAKSLWPASAWPIGTFCANILGGLLMGLLMGVLLGKDLADTERARLLLGVGVLGGFTTFSSFSLETVQMLERRDYVLAFGYSTLSVILSLAAVMAGLFLIRKFAL